MFVFLEFSLDFFQRNTNISNFVALVDRLRIFMDFWENAENVHNMQRRINYQKHSVFVTKYSLHRQNYRTIFRSPSFFN